MQSDFAKHLLNVRACIYNRVVEHDKVELEHRFTAHAVSRETRLWFGELQYGRKGAGMWIQM